MVTLKVKLKIKGPFVTAGLGAKRIGIDLNQLKTPTERPFISGTHIKGRLKFALLQLLLSYDEEIYTYRDIKAKDQIINKWMRHLSPILGGPEKYPSPVIIDNFILEDTNVFSINHRIALSRDTGTVQEGALAYIEGVNKGCISTWAGSILLPDNGIGGLILQELKSFIIHGFLWMDTLGAQNTIGWGRIVERQIDSPKINLEDMVEKIKALDIISYEQPPFIMPHISNVRWDSTGIALRLKSPLLVGDHSTKNNFFEGRDNIPGSVIKRALADYLLLKLGKPPGGWIKEEFIDEPLVGEYAEVIKVFPSLFISFALPFDHCHLDLKEIQRPIPLPLTSFAYKGWNSSLEGPGPWDILIRDIKDKKNGCKEYFTHNNGKRVIFKCDLGSLHGWQQGGRGKLFSPSHFIHTRTAIDNLTLASEEAKLFSYRAISDIYKSYEPEGGKEHQQFYASAITFPKSEGLKEKLLDTMKDIRALGKGSRYGLGQVECIPVNIINEDWKERLRIFNKRIGDAKFLIPLMLATEAILLEPFKVELESNLESLYENTWRKIFGEEANLKIFYTLHKLRGIRKEKAVPPVILTMAGSVFVLEIEKNQQTEAEGILEGLSLFGIEIDSYLKKIDEKWGCFCPYRKTNGYGEIIICHPIHLEGEPYE